MKRSKTKQQLMEELNDAHRRLAEFQAMEPERRMVGEALRSARARLQGLLLSSPAVIYVCEPGGSYRTTFISENITRQLGYDSREFIDEPDFYIDNLHPEDAPTVLAGLVRLFEVGDYVHEYRFRHKDGTYRWMRDECRLVRDGNGNPLQIVGFWIDVTERRQAEIEGQNHQEQLRVLASELSLTEERERRRLATDLHDSIGQTLAMCKLKLDELQNRSSPAVFANDLDHISTLLDRAIQGTRSLTFELSPPVLYELGLEAALESLVERMQQVNGTQIKLIEHRGPKPLTEDIAAFCFRAVQELLVNAVKHARARKIEVSTGRNRDRIRITVADDGIGFDTSGGISRKGRKGGFGLFSIKERLQYLGGSLEVDSKPGQGTRVTLSAPLRHRPIRKG